MNIYNFSFILFPQRMLEDVICPPFYVSDGSYFGMFAGVLLKVWITVGNVSKQCCD
jgi:hypothetical protein